MSLVLYDEDLRDYNYSDLVKAYNASVSTVPEAYDNPVILKNLMVRNIQSSGIKDPFEIGQELKIDKNLRERTQQKQKDEDALAAKIEARKPVEKEFQAVTATPGGGISEYLGQFKKDLTPTSRQQERTRRLALTDRAEGRAHLLSEEERKAKTPEELREEQIRSNAQARLKKILDQGNVSQAALQASGGAAGLEEALMEYYGSDGSKNLRSRTAQILRQHGVTT
jgi:hypothetical protein